MDLIDRQALLKQIDIDSDGEPGYYGDTWKFIDTIKSMPSATDTNVGTKLGTDLAEVGTDCISRKQAIEVVQKRHIMLSKEKVLLINDLEKLPSAQSKKGKWIKSGRWGRVYYCNQCRNYLDFDGVNAGRGSANFCPNCGAKMEVTDE